METTARTYFERVNSGDVEGILVLFADDAQLINPLTDEAGIRGKAALHAAYQHFFSTLVNSHASPTAIIIEGDKLVAPLHVEGKTKDGQPIAMNNLISGPLNTGSSKSCASTWIPTRIAKL
jgi:ketosteroid isomerase-like protein